LPATATRRQVAIKPLQQQQQKKKKRQQWQKKKMLKGASK